jgi:hypothetical protein
MTRIRPGDDVILHTHGYWKVPRTEDVHPSIEVAIRKTRSVLRVTAVDEEASVPGGEELVQVEVHSVPAGPDDTSHPRVWVLVSPAWSLIHDDGCTDVERRTGLQESLQRSLHEAYECYGWGSR